MKLNETPYDDCSPHMIAIYDKYFHESLHLGLENQYKIKY